MIPIAKPIIGEMEKQLVNEVIASGQLAQGPKVKELEEKFAKLCKVKYAIAVNNGTAALHCANYACGIKNGDEVITTPFTFAATANSVIMQGARPVFVDINEDTYNIDPTMIEEKITKKTKALLPVDLYGQPVEYDKLLNIAKKYNLKIIDDACQAVNAEYKGKKIGSIADVTCFSFYATKNMISGEGGVITSNDEEIVELCRRFRHHGQSEKTRYEYYDLGYNYRMMDLQAAIALGQIEKLEEFTQIRRRNANLLTNGLINIKGITPPKEINNVKHVFHQYTIKIGEEFHTNRDKVKKMLADKGIGCGVYYPKPLHLHPHFLKFGYKQGDFPVAEKISEQVLSLPVHPNVTKEEIEKIISSIKNLR
ncbi:MAG: DegT/DnrJ/EryC1/StrS family aminotransferase [Promethearchaeota archaeon]